MEETLFYKADAVFQGRLNQFIRDKNAFSNKYLIAGSNCPKHNFTAFYNAQTNQIELNVKGDSIEELVNAEKEFFKIVDNWLKDK